MELGFVNERKSPYYDVLRNNANYLRNKMTEAECVLWHYLKAGRMGVKFRRQHVVDNYIADFACISKGLLIEVDGEYHDEKAQQLRDSQREVHLKAIGFRLLRFRNEDILNDIDNVLLIIQQHLDGLET